VPSGFFGNFLDKFRKTIQQQVVMVIESSVGVMGLERAFDLFGLGSVSELKGFMEDNREAAEVILWGNGFLGERIHLDV
jgi:hypothetical protein